MRSKAPPLLPIFRSRHQADLLAWLLLHPGEEYPMTELAHRLEVPLNTLHREAQRLVEAGVLVARSVGRTRLLSANTAHRAVGPLTALLEVTFGPRTIVEEEFTAVSGTEQVIIYGSWAERYRGAAGVPPHDIDVLVIGTPARPEVYEAADRAQARLGMPVNPVLRSSQQWESGHDPLVAQIQASSFVRVLPRAGGDAR